MYLPAPAVVVTAGKQAGSGFFLRIGERPQLITAAHVVEGAATCAVLLRAKGSDVWVKGVPRILSREWDIAAVRLPKGFSHGYVVEVPSGRLPKDVEGIQGRMFGAVAEADQFGRLVTHRVEMEVLVHIQGGKVRWSPSPRKGMSGGPVLDERGRLLAMITHGSHCLGVGPGWWIIRGAVGGS